MGIPCQPGSHWKSSSVSAWVCGVALTFTFKSNSFCTSARLRSSAIHRWIVDVLLYNWKIQLLIWITLQQISFQMAIVLNCVYIYIYCIYIYILYIYIYIYIYIYYIYIYILYILYIYILYIYAYTRQYMPFSSIFTILIQIIPIVPHPQLRTVHFFDQVTASMLFLLTACLCRVLCVFFCLIYWLQLFKTL